MKKHKILLMLLLLAILVISFCGCEEIKLFFASEGTVKDDSQEKTDDLKKTEDPEDDVVKDDEMFSMKRSGIQLLLTRKRMNTERLLILA